MKFLIDGQLPRRLAQRFREAGHDAVHTLDLPNGNRTSDAEISATADREGRVVVTKDADFVDFFLIKREPRKLFLISTGNMTNASLESLILPRLSVIAAAFESHSHLELTHSAIIVHE